ncbi:MAG: Rrf2 family transcriptional regulator [Erysipelotrichaceae bacterium]|nr:Rrf2 family transcriptional regulator [Erysipelotrichaceae bacterium]
MDTKFSVALHIMIYIAETKNIPSSELLAKSVNTNSSHIRKIISGLKHSKLIESSQGKSGFNLAKNKNEITLADIYLSVYPEKKLINIHENPNQECPIGFHIKQLLTPVFDETQQVFLERLKKINLEQLIKNLYELGENK